MLGKDILRLKVKQKREKLSLMSEFQADDFYSKAKLVGSKKHFLPVFHGLTNTDNTKNRQRINRFSEKTTSTYFHI